MKDYCDWLKSVDGGLKPPRSANQHRNVVMNILHFLDSSGRQFSKLVCRKSLNSWISDFEARGRKPGTTKTYLGSVKLFYDFVLITEPNYINIEHHKIAQMKTIITTWCRNLHKLISKAKHYKQLEDLAKLPTPEEIIKLDNSAYKKEAIKTLFFVFSCMHPNKQEKLLYHTRLLAHVCSFRKRF